MLDVRCSCWVLVAALLVGAPMRAEEPAAAPLQEKSLSTAKLLAFDPLPADALYYAGRTRQAKWNGLLGVVGVGLIAGGFAALDGDEFTEGRDNGGDAKFSMILSGFVAYGASLVWDGIGGVKGTRAHNERVHEARRAAVLPLASVHEGTPMLGIHVQF